MDCPRCGTPMEGGICPECGFPVIRIVWDIRKATEVSKQGNTGTALPKTLALSLKSV